MNTSRWLSVVAIAAVAAGLAGCDRSPGAPERAADAPQALLNSQQAPTLLSCSALPQDSVSVVVGPEGGVIAVGPHTLTIPAGALAAPVTITAVTPAEPRRQVEFSPDGLTFARTVELRMSYAGCGLLGSPMPRRIVQVGDDLAILDVLPSLDLGTLLTTRAWLQHFSGYAVAW